jgi:PadR family transcriptional regulator, regulatory protein PadR
LRITYPTALVIAAVVRGHRYGFDVIDVTGLPSGTVYPILRRLEDSGMLRSRWEREAAAHDEGRPPRKYYQVTGSGQAAAREALERFPGAVAALVPAGVTSRFGA